MGYGGISKREKVEDMSGCGNRPNIASAIFFLFSFKFSWPEKMTFQSQVQSKQELAQVKGNWNVWKMW